MIEPTFDKDGYPTDETLDVVEHWPIATFADVGELLVYLHKAWWQPDWCWTIAKRRTREKYKGAPLRRLYYISTGGWSGNESLINAMEKNCLFWAFAWVSHRRGGHYIFEARG